METGKSETWDTKGRVSGEVGELVAVETQQFQVGEAVEGGGREADQAVIGEVQFFYRSPRPLNAPDCRFTSRLPERTGGVCGNR